MGVQQDQHATMPAIRESPRQVRVDVVLDAARFLAAMQTAARVVCDLGAAASSALGMMYVAELPKRRRSHSADRTRSARARAGSRRHRKHVARRHGARPGSAWPTDWTDVGYTTEPATLVYG